MFIAQLAAHVLAAPQAGIWREPRDAAAAAPGIVAQLQMQVTTLLRQAATSRDGLQARLRALHVRVEAGTAAISEMLHESPYVLWDP